MRCDTCKHWEIGDLRIEDQDAARVGFKFCTAVRERWVIEDEVTELIPKYPENEALVDDGHFDEVGRRWLEAHKRGFSKEKAYVQDGSGYKAYLITGPDFFCAKYCSLDSTQEVIDATPILPSHTS